MEKKYWIQKIRKVFTQVNTFIYLLFCSQIRTTVRPNQIPESKFGTWNSFVSGDEWKYYEMYLRSPKLTEKPGDVYLPGG
jgi:hypothetical protein